MKINLSGIVLVFCFLFISHIDLHESIWNKPNRVIVNDINSYYAYLPAIFIYKDISLSFIDKDIKFFSNKIWPKRTEDGGKVIITSSGMSMLYFPFFIVAHKLAPALGYEANGYTAPYKFALVFSSIFFLMIGLFFLRKLLLEFFSQTVTSITILATTLSTNILWYVTWEAPMSHVYSFSLISVFIFLTNKWYKKSKLSNTIFLGILTGIITLIRPTNILIVFIFMFWKTSSTKDITDRIKLLLSKYYLIVLMGISAIIVWLPQFYYWHLITGHYFYYSYPEDQRFFFNNPQLFSTLFSWRKGLLIYTPVIIFGLMGIFLLLKSKLKLFLPLIIFSLLNWYIISSWWDWWYGGGFGLRPFIDSYAVFAIGIATFLTWALKKKLWASTIFILLFLTSSVLGYKNYKKYYGGSIHWVAMTKEAYFDSFWRDTPSKTFKDKLRYPDYELARKGIYKYAEDK